MINLIQDKIDNHDHQKKLTLRRIIELNYLSGEIIFTHDCAFYYHYDDIDFT